MNKSFVDYVIRDYSKPMGVATYKTADEMPEKLRKALPPVEGGSTGTRHNHAENQREDCQGNIDFSLSPLAERKRIVAKADEHLDFADRLGAAAL